MTSELKWRCTTIKSISTKFELVMFIKNKKKAKSYV